MNYIRYNDVTYDNSGFLNDIIMRKKPIKQEIDDTKKAYIKQTRKFDGTIDDPKEFTKEWDLLQTIKKYLVQLL
jgi:hypothetical protein